MVKLHEQKLCVSLQLVFQLFCLWLTAKKPIDIINISTVLWLQVFIATFSAGDMIFKQFTEL